MAIKERKILVAVDEGEESSYARIISKRIPSSSSTSNHPNHLSMEQVGYSFSPDIIATIDKYRNDVAETVIDKANKLCKHLHNVNVETRVEMGDPRDVICEAAEKMAVDMVVLGSHGYGLIKRAFLGSVSNHCAQHIKRPVLIVKKANT